jgi:hypothetical protein
MEVKEIRNPLVWVSPYLTGFTPRQVNTTATLPNPSPLSNREIWKAMPIKFPPV